MTRPLRLGFDWAATLYVITAFTRGWGGEAVDAFMPDTEGTPHGSSKSTG